MNYPATLNSFRSCLKVIDTFRRLYEVVGDVGESIVNLAIYFTISTIVLPLATLWLLAKLSGSLFSVRGP